MLVLDAFAALAWLFRCLSNDQELAAATPQVGIEVFGDRFT
jgi:hypothetical protein